MFAVEEEISPSLRLDQLVGQQIGAYRIEALAGCGQLNAVYQARHLKSKELVLLTVFTTPTRGNSEYYLARFKQEAEALTALSHPGLLPLVSYGEHHGLPYFVTEAATGTTLAEVLAKQGPLSLDQGLAVLEQITPVLDYLQEQGIVHHCLRPTSLLLTERGVIQVTGLGMMHVLTAVEVVNFDHPYAHLLSIIGTYLGRPAYLAPERVMGQEIDTRADLYALGVVLYELLTGRTPFSDAQGSFLQVCLQPLLQHPFPDLTALRPDLPVALDAVLRKALATRPSERFQNASDFLEACRMARRTDDSDMTEQHEQIHSRPVEPPLEPITETMLALSLATPGEQGIESRSMLTEPPSEIAQLMDTNQSEQDIPSAHQTVNLSALRPAPWLESRFFIEQAMATQDALQSQHGAISTNPSDIDDRSLVRWNDVAGASVGLAERTTNVLDQSTSIIPFSTEARDVQTAQQLRLAALIAVSATVKIGLSRLFQPTSTTERGVKNLAEGFPAITDELIPRAETWASSHRPWHDQDNQAVCGRGISRLATGSRSSVEVK